MSDSSNHHDDHDPDAHAEGHEEHHGNMKTFVAVFGALIVLTSMSFLVANLDFIMATPSVGWSIMLSISCAKAMLVITFFMHMLWEANWKYVLTIPASMMSVFLVVMLIPDIGLRTRHYSESRWRYAPPPQEVHMDDEDSDAHDHADGDVHGDQPAGQDGAAQGDTDEGPEDAGE
jgi:cytochrome c oxidase subunit 4